MVKIRAGSLTRLTHFLLMGTFYEQFFGPMFGVSFAQHFWHPEFGDGPQTMQPKCLEGAQLWKTNSFPLLSEQLVPKNIFRVERQHNCQLNGHGNSCCGCNIDGVSWPFLLNQTICTTTCSKMCITRHDNQLWIPQTSFSVVEMRLQDPPKLVVSRLCLVLFCSCWMARNIYFRCQYTIFVFLCGKTRPI